MADQKYSALTLFAPAQNDVFAVNDTSASGGTGSSMAVTISSAVASGVSTGVLFFDQYPAGDPASTAAGFQRVFARNVAGSVRLQTVGEYGDWRSLQRSLFNDSMWMWMGNSSAPGWVTGGGIATNAGTFSSAAPVMGSALTTRRRATYRTSSAVANLNAGITSANNDYFTGSTSGYAGFFFMARVGIDIYSSNTSWFVGMTQTASNSLCTSNPTTLPNTVGFAIVSTTGSPAWAFIHSSNSAVSTSETISGQTTPASLLGYDFYIFSPPINTSIIYYRMDELNTGSTIVNSSVTNFLPNSTSFMKAAAMCGNNTNVSTGSARIGIIKLYVEQTI